MSRGWYWKVFSIVLLAILAVLYILPSLMRERFDANKLDENGIVVLDENGNPEKELWYPKMFRRYLTLGLDLQGGVLLQYGVDINAALRSKASLYSDDIKKRLEDTFEEDGVEYKEITVKPTDSGAIITTDPATALGSIDGSFFEQFSVYDSGSKTSAYTKVFEITEQNDSQIKVDFSEGFRDYLERYAVDQGVQTITQRIDKLAVKEPEIRKGSSNSIVIQLPGLEEADFSQAQQIIEQTAQLQFKRTDDDQANQTYLAQLTQRVPQGSPVTADRGGLGRDVAGTEIYLRAAKKEHLIAFINAATNFADELKIDGRIQPKARNDFENLLKDQATVHFGDLRKETLKLTFKAPTDLQVVKDAINQYIRINTPETTAPIYLLKAEDFVISNEAGAPIEEGAGPQQVFVLSKKLRVPDDHELLLSHEIETDSQGVTKDDYWRTYWLWKKTEITGEYLTDAQVNFDENRQPVVSFTMNSEGANKLAVLSKQNIGKRFAIILDNEVKSAPYFRSEIPNGRGQITLGAAKNPSAMLKEAQSLSIVLQAGALPAPLTRQFVTRVGPQLGQEAIEGGVQAIIVGLSLVFLFMAFYYRKAGLIADFGLALNMIFLVGIMAALGATLTLPGIAGVALTIATSVDSNVLIFERIREELRLGKTPRQAIDAGYKNAIRTILDANATNMISALVLSWYGSGPVKGFAVTLMIGLLTSVFTSTFATRLVFQYIAQRAKLERLSI